MAATDYLPANLPAEARQLTLLGIAKQNRDRYEDLKSSPVLAAALGYTPEMFELVDRQLAASDAKDAEKKKKKWYLEPQEAAGLRSECLKGNSNACNLLFEKVNQSPCAQGKVFKTVRMRINSESGSDHKALERRLILELYDPYCAAQYAPVSTSRTGVIGQAQEDEKSNTLLYILLGAGALGLGYYLYTRR